MTGAAEYPCSGDAVDGRFASVDGLFFVIGAQKAGTTWLSKYFKAHPNVSVPEWKEHDYWNMVEGRPGASRMLQAQAARRRNESKLRKLVSSLPWTLHSKRQRAITLALKACDEPYPPYAAYADVILANATDKTIAAGEICPEYALLKSETYSKMASLNPNVRFVFVLRDPVDRFVSGIKHTTRKSLRRNDCPRDTLSSNIRQISGQQNARAIALTRYDETMKRLEAVVPKDRIFYVFFEELFEQETLRRLCDFLGLPFVPGRIRKKANRSDRRDVPVSAEDKACVARVLAPVYDAMEARFGRRLPSRWMESEALCRSAPVSHAKDTIRHDVKLCAQEE